MKQTIRIMLQIWSVAMLNNDPHLFEALKKISVHQLTITEASEQYDIPKRAIYKAARQQQLNKQAKGVFNCYPEAFAAKLTQCRNGVS